MSEVYFHLTPLFVDNTTDTGLTILYDPPSDVGADRIVDAVAALHKYGTPCIVVDFGTATNFEVIDDGGRYLGGVITPGISISTDALFARAARLPRVGIERPHNVIGTSTVSAIQSGPLLRLRGARGRHSAPDDRRAGPTPARRRDGRPGAAHRDRLGVHRRSRSTLTLDGLRLVYERVRGASA